MHHFLNLKIYTSIHIKKKFFIPLNWLKNPNSMKTDDSNMNQLEFLTYPPWTLFVLFAEILLYTLNSSASANDKCLFTWRNSINPFRRHIFPNITWRGYCIFYNIPHSGNSASEIRKNDEIHKINKVSYSWSECFSPKSIRHITKWKSQSIKQKKNGQVSIWISLNYNITHTNFSEKSEY